VANALSAAAAIVHELPLLSKNQKGFRFLKEAALKLLPYTYTPA
jgi:hypothetical protein